MAPIDGTVIRAGSYTLYCDHTDNFVVIEPSGRPGWELKIFHFSGLQVGVGDEVIASDTMIATGGRICRSYPRSTSSLPSPRTLTCTSR